MENINEIQFSSNFPLWAKPDKMDVSFVDMGDAGLSYSIKIPASEPHEFSLDWWIQVRGERFYNTQLKPEGFKDDKSLMYNYTLVFDSERRDLKRFVWVDIDKLSGVPLIKSYANIFKLTLKEFVSKLNDNLIFYGLSDRWEIRIDPLLPTEEEPIMLNAEDAFLWDVLQQTTELYGDTARWFIEAEGNKLVIKVGYPAVEIEHIFEYGGDTPSGDGGLVKISRTLNAERLTTVLAGRGGERNIPERYFEAEGDNFPGDPDFNSYTASLNLHNLMPKCFRDYNRGWNKKIVVLGETEAYNQGVADWASSTPEKSLYRPIEWRKSEEGIAKYGEIWDRLQPKEDIYPTIQNITADDARRAGVVTTAVGRLDEVIWVESITGSDDPEAEDYKPTFDIAVKDIGFDLRNPEFWAKENMSMAFTTGWLSQSEDYNFEIAGVRNSDGTYAEVKIYPDTTKVNERGERSAWRITLMKSNAELDATGKMLPNSITTAVEDDKFFFFNINLPHSYVLIAEQRQQDYLDAALGKIDHEMPIFTAVPDRIFCATFSETDKLKAGAMVRVANAYLVEDAYETLHIQSITLKYDFQNRVLPDWDMVVTDKIFAALNPIQRVSADVSSLSQNQITEANVAGKLTTIGDRRWLRKDGIADISKSPTKFAKEVSSIDYTGAGFEKSGWALTSHPNFPEESLAIFDNIIARKTFSVFEVISNSIKYMGGKMIFSATSMDILKVEDGSSYWKLYFDTKNGQLKNLWNVGDMAICQIFNAENIQTKYYRLRVVKANINDDFIHVYKGIGDNPADGDFILQHGHTDNPQRQNILTIDTIGGARFTSLQGLTETDSVGKIVAEMGWIDGAPKFFVGNANSSYIDFNGATELLNITGVVTFRSGSSGLTNLEEWGKAQQDIDEAKTIAEQSKSEIAVNLGYESYDKMLEAAQNDKTIIDGGYLRTNLIDTDTLIAKKLAVVNLNTSDEIVITPSEGLAIYNNNKKTTSLSGVNISDLYSELIGTTNEIKITESYLNPANTETILASGIISIVSGDVTVKSPQINIIINTEDAYWTPAEFESFVYARVDVTYSVNDGLYVSEASWILDRYQFKLDAHGYYRPIVANLSLWMNQQEQEFKYNKSGPFKISIIVNTNESNVFTDSIKYSAAFTDSISTIPRVKNIIMTGAAKIGSNYYGNGSVIIKDSSHYAGTTVNINNVQHELRSGTVGYKFDNNGLQLMANNMWNDLAQGFVRYPDGLMIQWGTIIANYGVGSTTFPIAFFGKPFSIIGNGQLDEAAVQNIISFDTTGMTNTTVRWKKTYVSNEYYGESALNANYIVIGRWRK